MAAVALLGASLPTAPARIAGLLAGDFDNAAQHAAAPDALKVPPTVNGDWLDLQSAALRRVSTPGIDGEAVYLEWRTGSPSGPISRQRLWVFRMDGDTPVMDFYTILAPERWAGRGDIPGAFAAMTLADLKPYGGDCAMRFVAAGNGWRGAIDPARCRIVAASGRGMRIAATVDVDAKGFEYRESGTLDDGRVAFRVPPSQPYRFVRRH